MSNSQSTINPNLEPWTFTVPLALTAHSRAEQLRRYQSNPDKGKQVYLNTLAMYAVHIYLQCQGFETNWENNNSYNPVMYTLMDAADLEVKNHGKLECRPVLPEQDVVYIPAEVWPERIGYVAVQLSESLREATVLGFIKKAIKSELSLRELRSLGELPGYLNQIKPTVNLGQWFEDIFATGWQAVESLFGTNSSELAVSFRRAPQIVRGCKLIELGTAEQSVVMVVTLIRELQQEIDISVEVQPSPGQTNLPSHLKLIVLNEEEEAVMHIQSGSDNQIMQLEFSGEESDRFGVKVVLGDVSVMENFVL